MRKDILLCAVKLMTKYIIDGVHILRGDIKINGSKNAALPILAASILNKGVTRILNCPNISDVHIMCELLEELGCNVTFSTSKSIVEIDATQINSSQILSTKTHKCRASVLLLGALLGRLGQAELSYPGGCIIGERPLDLHKTALEAMGYETNFTEDKIKSAISSFHDTSTSRHVYLNFPSVGATENALLAAAGLGCEVHIYGAATEPEIQSLGEYLTLIGTNISGLGTGHIIISGTLAQANPILSYRNIPDRIETATYMIMGAGLGNKLKIHGANSAHTKSIVAVLRQMGCIIREISTGCSGDCIYEISQSAYSKRLTAPELIIARPYPGFPTDAQSLILPLLCISKGETIICDSVFPQRFKAAYELVKAGGYITKKPYGILISGRNKLHKAVLNSYDLRGGAAMITAGLFADGQSIIYDNDYIKRGYVNLTQTLRSVGAHITEESC